AQCCASHSGSALHIETVQGILAKIGLDESYLQCGVHAPGDAAERERLAQAGEQPTAIHNNCSGKHAGMLALARYLGAPLESYLQPEHPAQQRILNTLARLSGVPAAAIAVGIDGCSAPTFALPICGTATAFARIAAARTGWPAGDTAARRISRAMMEHPHLIAGTGRFDTILMRELAGVLFCKGGAEGFFCVGVPGRGIGIALKALDGAGRATAPAAMHLLGVLAVLPEPLPPALDPFARPVVTNAAGIAAGEMRVVERGAGA
ncbi:MAG: asparaginase, partial [Armatimonadota bacterium]|nr:asparaginase [Armatimonadota bacterium]